MPPQGECPYCQLIDNPQQLMVVGETDDFYAWLEVQPRAKGHTQIVPKEHKESLMEFTPGEYDQAMTLARKVVEKAERGLGADGASITVNINETGGQMLPHAYISVFPRFEEDENAGTPTGAIFQHREELQDQEKLKQLQEKMSSIDVNFGEPKKPHPDSQKFREENTQQTEENKEQTEKEKEEGEEITASEGQSIEWK